MKRDALVSRLRGRAQTRCGGRDQDPYSVEEREQLRGDSWRKGRADGGRAPSGSSGSRVDEGFVNNRAAIRRPGKTRTRVVSGQGALPLLPFFVGPPLHHRPHLFLYQHPPSPSSLIFLLLLPFLLRILLTTTTSSFTSSSTSSSLATPAASFLPLPPQRGRGRNILDVYVPRGIEGGYLHTITGGYRWVGSVGRCLPVLQPEEAKRRRRRGDLWRLYTASYRLLVCLPIRATSEPSDQTKLQSTPRTQTVQTCQPGRHTRCDSTLSRATDLLTNTEIPTVASVTLHRTSF